jgi:hypothetical protein
MMSEENNTSFKTEMKRLELPDLLKGFAVFLIIPVHILELFIDNPGRDTVFGKILLFLGGPFCVPVFMMVMGYFTANSKKSPTRHFFRGVKVFIVGILLNIALNFHLLIKIKFDGWPYNPWEYIWSVDILYLAGLSLMFLSLLKIPGKGQEWVSLILFFLITGLTGVMNEIAMSTEKNYIIPFIAGDYTWSYFPIFPWLAYPLAGFAFFYLEGKIKSFLHLHQKFSAVIIGLIGIMVLIFYKWGVKTTVHLPAYYHHTFWYSLWALGIVSLWILFVRYINRKFRGICIVSFLKWLGKNITIFYLIQWLIIGNIATAIYQTQPISSYFYWMAGIFSVTMVLTWILEKTGLKPARM